MLGFFFSYSDFFLPSKAGVTDVTAMFVNFNRRSAVTQATTYIKQIVINTLPCQTYMEENVQITMQWVYLFQAAVFCHSNLKKINCRQNENR